MKLWLLRPREDIRENDPWEPWYDKTFGFVVRAETEQDARMIANASGGDETGPISHDTYRHGGDPWLSPEFSSCEELSPTGTAQMILADHHSA